MNAVVRKAKKNTKRETIQQKHGINDRAACFVIRSTKTNETNMQVRHSNVLNNGAYRRFTDDSHPPL